jgi:CBS domain containing-hemolysin-like protein
LVSSDDEYATIAGLLLAQHEELPKVGETFVIGAYRFEVREMSDRRIELVRITRE